MDHRFNEMQTEALWNKAREAGMSRRKFLALLASSGAAAVLVACAPNAVTTPTATPTPTPTSTPKPTATPTPTPTPTPKSTATPTAPVTIIHQSPYSKTTSRMNYAFADPLLDLIEKKSQGSIVFKRYYDAQLVSTTGQLEAGTKGTIDMFHCPGTYYESIVPEGDYDLAFFNYPSQASASLFLDLPEIKQLFRDAYAKTNVLCLGPWAHDHQTLMTKFQLTKMSDLKGLKMRGGGGMANLGLEAIGATPVYIDMVELYTALQRGTVDGCITAEYMYYNSKYYEVIKHQSLPPVIPVQGEKVWIGMKKWQELGPDLQKIVEDAFHEMSFWFIAQSYREDEQVRILAKTKGTIFSEMPADEFAKMKAVCEPIKDTWAKKSPGCAKLLQMERDWEKLDIKKWKFA